MCRYVWKYQIKMAARSMNSRLRNVSTALPVNKLHVLHIQVFDLDQSTYRLCLTKEFDVLRR